jgi:hypothetical protein
MHCAQVIPADTETLCQFAHRAGVELVVAQRGNGRWVAGFKPHIYVETEWSGYVPVTGRSTGGAYFALEYLARHLSDERVRKVLHDGLLWNTYTYYDLTRTIVTVGDALPAAAAASEESK